MSGPSIVAIDQGTTSTRAIRFGYDGTVQAVASRALAQQFPRSGWVEHDPESIWLGVRDALREVINDDVAVIGVANQRETILLWERASGEVLYNAIGWQDRRGASMCESLRAQGVESMVRQTTGLLLDPYFSATKLRWLLDSISGARARAERGELAAGTVDSFILWRLTGGQVHATDVTNASRTMLYDIRRHCWDADLLSLFGIPEAVLPDVHSNDHLFGMTAPAHTGRAVPITGMAGDQQAALIGQRCFAAGAIKVTYGTGGFVLANIGKTPILSSNRLLTTPAFRISGQDAYAMEGSIFIAGAAITWLRDRMHLIGNARETAELAATVPDDHGVHFVPAFVGLGAPHWRTDVRASISGMTLDTGPAHIARAALEAVAYQTCDLIDTLMQDGIARPSAVRIDGAMSTNNWFGQFLADMIGLPVERTANHEATALGAALLAGLSLGIWSQRTEMDPSSQSITRFEPNFDDQQRSKLLCGWRAAVQCVLQSDRAPELAGANA